MLVGPREVPVMAVREVEGVAAVPAEGLGRFR